MSNAATRAIKHFTLRFWPRAGEPELINADEGAVVDAVVEDDEPKKFGVRSNLHRFYQFYSPNVNLDNGEWYLVPPQTQRTSVYLCRLVTVLGALLLLAGAGLIIIGYTQKGALDVEDALLRISIQQDDADDNTFYIQPERLNELLRDPLRDYKISGFCVFSAGAAMMALSLLLPMCLHVFGAPGKRLPFVSTETTPAEPPVRVYPALVTSRFRAASTKLASPQQTVSPSSGPVPVMEALAKVQPTSKKTTPDEPTARPISDEADALLR